MSTIRRSSRFFSTVTRYRRGAGSYVAGEWVDGTLTTSSLTASVQPAGGQDLLRLPESLRTRDAVKVFVGPGELRTADERTGLAADRILHEGEEYEVVGVEEFTATQMPHVEAMAVRVDRAGLSFAESPA